ncbi:uncharacterized protein LOC132737817 [Ruditapes philippinarum]|uniref:uncharacterized protein LOC132737817 n=1 Tax=Ruditapes philippinarum TaxID=129788 RepID=UPI00295AE565|nr:uncharacterized protein LOC132737817 [Ruditapes philippinarum]
MDFRWIIIISSFCVTCCYGDYTCLCNYNVELPIYTSPDLGAQVIGYMYEFDCKNLLSESNPEWPSIEFEHQLGFVKTNGQVRIQTCPGSVPTADKIASTTHTPTTVLTSTVKSSPTTLPLTTTTRSTTAVPSTTTSSSNASTSALSSSSSTNLSSSTTLSFTTTTSLSRSSYPSSTSNLSTFLLSIPTSSSNTNLSMTSTLSSETNLPASSTLPSKTTLSTASTLTSSTMLYTNSSLPLTSILSLTSTLPSKTTLSSTASTSSSNTRASTLPSNTTLSSISTLTSKTEFTSLKPILSSFLTAGVVSTSLKSSNHSTAVSANERSTSPGYTNYSQMYQSTNKSSFSSTAGVNTITIKTTPPPNSASTPSEIITRNSSYLSSKFPMENSSLLSHLPTNHTSTRQTIPSNKSSTTYTPIISFSSSLNSSISSPNAVSQSSTNGNLLSTILSTPETEKTPIAQSSTTQEWAMTSTKQASSNFTAFSPSIYSSNFHNVSTAKPSLTPSNYTSSLKTTSVSTPITIILSSSGSTEKPMVSDRVDLCPYKNLAMSMYNRTTYTYPLFRQYGNYCYELRLKLGNWFDAQQDCVSRGGELAVIQNKEVQARVFDLTSSTKYHIDVWIGLHDLHQEGTWEWVNGAKISKSSFNEGILINPAFTDSQDCVLMDAKSGVWKNTACTSILFDVQSYPWVCQYKMT